MTESIEPTDPPQEGAEGNTPDPESTPPTATPPVEVTPEVQALIDEAAVAASRKANKEAIAAKKRLAELEAAEQKRKDAELSEAERLTKERDEAQALAAQAQQTAQAALLRAEVATQSIALNIVDSDTALAIMDRSDIKFNDDGTIDGVKQALDALTKAKPFLVESKQRNPHLDPNNGGRGGEPTLTPEQQTAQLYSGSHGKPIW